MLPATINLVRGKMKACHKRLVVVFETSGSSKLHKPQHGDDLLAKDPVGDASRRNRMGGKEPLLLLY